MINQTISHYRIIGKLGSGGMGVVYEAEDLNLGRKVALKFLPPQLSSDQNALDRFMLEARTASALNHPNICTIYAVEKTDGADAQAFIAMELLEGQTLDQKLSAGPFPADRLLDIAIQLADALDAAHTKGIIHRDIKPANIFITQRGQVKVLDFGLAKLARRDLDATIGATAIDRTQDSRHPANLTNPGATVGTIAYMSPEQARGEDLDVRTDLFSVGAVIYQMATGRSPFPGSTSAVIFHAILQLEPAAVSQLNPELPAKLQEIVEKLLEKDRDLRYQSAADLRGDLKRLKRDSESGRKPAPISSSSPVAVSAAPVSENAPRKTSSSSAVAAAILHQHKTGWGLTIAVVLLLVAAAAYGIYAFVTRSHPVPFQNISVTKVTDSGTASLAAISPDGKYMVTLMHEAGGRSSLWLRNLPSNSNTQVQSPADVYYYYGLAFSPDGNYFYFIRTDPGNPALRFLYRAPLLGGTPQKLLSDIDSAITFSPDGSKLAFLRYDNPEPGKYQLIVDSIESGEEKVLTSGSNSHQLFWPAWSPDGKTIVCDELHEGNLQVLKAVDVATGKQTTVGDKPQIFFEPRWMPDGRGLVGLSSSVTSNYALKQIVYTSYPDRKMTPITHDTNTYNDITLAASGRLMAAILNEARWNLDVISTIKPTSTAQQITSTNSDTNFTWTKDNQIIDDQHNSLHLVNLATGAKIAIPTEEGSPSGDPAACLNGQYVVFDMAFHAGSGSTNVWRMDAGGGNLKQLTNGTLDHYSVCSSDSRWVYYIEQGDEATLGRVPIDGGAAQKISNLPMDGLFDVSPDGKLAAFATLEHTGEHKEKLAIVSTESSQVVKMLDFEHPRLGALLRFSPDGKAVVYPNRQNGVDNLWWQALDGSKGHALTDFKAERIYDFHWSFDGKQLAMVRGHTDSDVVLIRDQGK
jgi:eukaryotic-like serine/threonine-protein kinase